MCSLFSLVPLSHMSSAQVTTCTSDLRLVSSIDTRRKSDLRLVTYAHNICEMGPRGPFDQSPFMWYKRKVPPTFYFTLTAVSKLYSGRVNTKCSYIILFVLLWLCIIDSIEVNSLCILPERFQTWLTCIHIFEINMNKNSQTLLFLRYT